MEGVWDLRNGGIPKEAGGGVWGTWVGKPEGLWGSPGVWNKGKANDHSRDFCLGTFGPFLDTPHAPPLWVPLPRPPGSAGEGQVGEEE